MMMNEIEHRGAEDRQQDKREDELRDRHQDIDRTRQQLVDPAAGQRCRGAKPATPIAKASSVVASAMRDACSARHRSAG